MVKNKEKAQDLVFGINPIMELLRAKKRKISLIYTTKNPPKAWEKIKSMLPPYTQIQYVDKAALNKIAFTEDHQSIVAFAGPYVLRNKFFEPEKQKFLVMLDGVQDPRNFGAILRSAYCTGVQGVIVTAKNSSPVTATVLKASAGLAEYLDIVVVPSAKDACLKLKQAGYSIYLSTLEKAENALDVQYALPLCIVIGSEGAGISKEIMSQGTKIKLPQVAGNVDVSYNASVAAGILLFHVATNKKLI